LLVGSRRGGCNSKSRALTNHTASTSVHPFKQGAPEVLDLLQPSSPFRAAPPTSVKIDLAAVAPARKDAKGAAADPSTSGDWWTVEVVRELLPPIERGNAAVAVALRSMHWEGGGGGKEAAASGLGAALRGHPTVAGWGVFLLAAAGVAVRHVVR
jgi:hypothetical protein